MIKTCLFLSLLLFEAIHSNFIVQTDKDAMAYLKKYGYTLQQCGNKKMACVMNQQNLKTIIKDFQRQFKLRVTGRLDFQTKQLMKRPRCAVPDRKLSLLVQWSNGDAIWNHQRLTWSFRDENTTYAHWIEEAFRKWKEIIPQFEFHQVCSTCQADINLSFQATSHGHEGHNEHEGFDPGTLAHAHYPKDGTIHFNSNMKWTHR
jgi:gelatinase A